MLVFTLVAFELLANGPELAIKPQANPVATHRVQSAEQLHMLIGTDKLSAGDIVIWADGDYSDVTLKPDAVHAFQTDYSSRSHSRTGHTKRSDKISHQRELVGH